MMQSRGAASGKKVLILHASAGFGHQKAALGIMSGLKAVDPLTQVDVKDALDFFPRWFKQLYVGSYLFIMHRLPFLWGLFYWMSDNALGALPNRLLRRLANGFLGRKLERLIVESGADLVCSTHFLPTEVLAHLRKKGTLRSPALTVVTDFLVHRYWVFRQMDHYAVASTATREALVKLGVSPDKIHVTGIPIDMKFAGANSRAETCRKHGLQADLVTILFTSGGTGAGPLREMVRRLSDNHAELQILVVCGKNEELFASLKAFAESRPNVKPFGFVDFMDELMDCSDILVGKAGGLTVSEALAKFKPFLVVEPVPGQESLNAEYLEKNGAGFWVRGGADLVRRLEDLLKDPRKIEQMKESIRAIGRPRASEDIAQLGFVLMEGAA